MTIDCPIHLDNTEVCYRLGRWCNNCECLKALMDTIWSRMDRVYQRSRAARARGLHERPLREREHSQNDLSRCANRNRAHRQSRSKVRIQKPSTMRLGLSARMMKNVSPKKTATVHHRHSVPECKSVDLYVSVEKGILFFLVALSFRPAFFKPSSSSSHSSAPAGTCRRRCCPARGSCSWQSNQS